MKKRKGEFTLAVLLVLCIVCSVIWIIGYPVYCIINNIRVFAGGIYAIVTSMFAVILNILNLIYKVRNQKED